LIVFYDSERLDWDEVLAKAWESRPKGEVGMIVAIPRGGKIYRDLMRKTARQAAIEKTHRNH
jgi:gluconate kinase